MKTRIIPPDKVPPIPIPVIREEAPKPREVSAATEQDNRLTDEVSKKLEGDPTTMGAGLRVSVNDGVVTLVGTVESDSKKNAILEIVRYMPGVKRVRDGLEVSAVEQVPSKKLLPARELLAKLRRSQPVTQFMCVIEPSVQYLPDVTRNGKETAALLGKAFLFGADSKPAEADGQLTVVMTDTTPRPSGTPPKIVEMTHFDDGTLKKLLANDERLGRHYLFPIPWPSDWADVTQVTIQAKCKPNPESKLTALYHPVVKVTVKVGKE